MGDGGCDRVRHGGSDETGIVGVGGAMQAYGERWKVSSWHPRENSVQRCADGIREYRSVPKPTPIEIRTQL
jgi:hypothetical protein